MAIDPRTLNLSALEQQHGLPSGLLQSVMNAESSGNPNAVSPKGAQGLFQFMPQTAKAYGINPLDPQQAAVGAARMYGDLSKQFGGDVPSMLAAYNWGSGNLTNKGMENAPKETRDYISRVQSGMGKQYAQTDTGIMTDASMPALPEGFVLQPDMPSLPDGFVLSDGSNLPVKAGSGVDAAKSVASNLVGGGIDTAMILPNMINAAVAGPQMLGRGIADTISPMLGAEPQERGELWQPFYGSSDIENKLGTAYQPETTAGKAAALPARIIGGIAGAKTLQKAEPSLTRMATNQSSGKSPSVDKVPLKSDELRREAKKYFDKFTNSGGKYSSKLTDELADTAESLKSKGIAGVTKKSDEALNDTLDYYVKLKGKELSPAELQKLDQSLADDVARFNKSGEYNFGRILNDVKYQLRDKAFNPNNASKYISGAKSDSINDLLAGNKLWQQSYKAKDIEKILQKSMGVENPQTSIRTGIKNLLANDKKMQSYTPKDRAILEKAMKRGVLGGFTKLGGGRLVNSLVGAGSGYSAGGPVGAAVGGMAGKAAGGVLADISGNIQAGRLNKGLYNIQNPPKPMPPQDLTPLLRGGVAAANLINVPDSPLVRFGKKFDRKVINKGSQ